jgi:hypothetical protein
MDFVMQRPLHEYPGGPLALAKALGELVAKLQATPPVSRPRGLSGVPGANARVFAKRVRSGPVGS